MRHLILDDDDICFRYENGERIAFIDVGTRAAEYVLYTGTYEDEVRILLRGGGDSFEKGVLAGPVRVYADALTGGDDRIDFAWGDKILSGPGNDLYRLHGDSHGRPPAEIWMNMEDDTLVIPADRVSIEGFRFRDRETDGDSVTATLTHVHLEFHTPGSPFANPEVILNLGDLRGGKEVRPVLELEFERGEARSAIRELLDGWIDDGGIVL